MYPFEQYVKILKMYVKNRNRPKRCIVECYIYEEAIEFCSEYLTNIESIRLSKSHFIKRKDDNNKTGQSMVTISQDLFIKHINISWITVMK